MAEGCSAKHGWKLQAPPPSAGRLALGAWGERVAERYLEGLGMVVVERNWRVRDGELDIVAWDPEGRRWTVVEVKTRTSEAFGHPFEALSAAKRARMWRVGVAWIAEHRDLVQGRRLRFAALGLIGPDPATARLELLPDLDVR